MTTTEAMKYLKPGAIVPVDVQTTALLVNALREALASQGEALRLPDKLVYDGYETPQYIEGWNDCREFMKGMK